MCTMVTSKFGFFSFLVLPFITMHEKIATQDSVNCLNCGQRMGPSARFCSQCGQEHRMREESFLGFIRHFLNDYFTFDSKISRSFVPLLIKPGFLTSEYIAGRRVRYIPPIRLYLFVSIVFFLVLSMKNRSAAEVNEDVRFWNRFFEVQLPRLFFLLLPLFALILHAVNTRSKPNFYVRHFIFSLHFHVFIFVFALLFLGCSELFMRLGWGMINGYIGLGFVGATLGYLFIAMRRVYGGSHARTAVQMVLLLLVYSIVLSSVVLLALLILAARA